MKTGCTKAPENDDELWVLLFVKNWCHNFVIIQKVCILSLQQSPSNVWFLSCVLKISNYIFFVQRIIFLKMCSVSENMTTMTSQKKLFDKCGCNLGVMPRISSFLKQHCQEQINFISAKCMYFESWGQRIWYLGVHKKDVISLLIYLLKTIKTSSRQQISIHCSLPTNQDINLETTLIFLTYIMLLRYFFFHGSFL